MEQAGLGRRLWVRDDNERRVRAIFKWAPSPSKRYALAMERVAYVLADSLGLLVPATYLEDCGGQLGCAQLRIEGIAWQHAAAAVPWIFGNTLNEADWPLAVAFDLWMANPDRHERNIVIEPHPPGTRPPLAAACRTWLVDNERCGLWPPVKFDQGCAQLDLLNPPADGSMRADVEQKIGESMPEPYRQAFENLSTDARAGRLDQIRAVSDNVIAEAVQEVPADFISSTGRTLTIQVLRARRDHIYNLATAVFP